MITLLMLFGIIGCIGGIMLFIFMLADGEPIGGALGFIVLVAGAILLLAAFNNDQDYNGNNINYSYGIVRGIGNSLKIDDMIVDVNGVDISGVGIGDVLKVKYIDGELDEYLLSYEKVDNAK